MERRQAGGYPESARVQRARERAVPAPRPGEVPVPGEAAPTGDPVAAGPLGEVVVDGHPSGVGPVATGGVLLDVAGQVKVAEGPRPGREHPDRRGGVDPRFPRVRLRRVELLPPRVLAAAGSPG